MRVGDVLVSEAVFLNSMDRELVEDKGEEGNDQQKEMEEFRSRVSFGRMPTNIFKMFP